MLVKSINEIQGQARRGQSSLNQQTKAGLIFRSKAMRKLLMAMLVFCAAGQAFALNPLGPPDATVEKGKFGAGPGIYRSKEDFVESLQRDTWELVPEIYYYTYEEPGPDIKDTGTFFGLNGAVTWRDWVPVIQKEHKYEGTKWMQRLEARFAFGTIDYEGYTVNTKTGERTPLNIDGIDDYVMEFRALMGVDYLKPTSMETIYAGLGYRYLYDDFQYSRESTYLYVPIGLKTTGNLKGNWSVDATAEFDILLWGQQVSGDILEFEQDTGYGLRGSVRFQKHGKKTDFIFEPFVRYWNIDDSDVDCGFYEPQNETLEIGIKFGWLF